MKSCFFIGHREADERLLPAGIPNMGRQNQRNDSYLRHQTGKQSGTAETGTGKHRKSIKTESVNANKKRHCTNMCSAVFSCLNIYPS